MDDAVDHRGGDGLVSEDPAPTAEGQVRGQDQRGVFIAARDELEEQVRSVLLDGEVADLVDDDQPVTAKPCELARQLSLPVGVGEAGNPVRRRCEENSVPFPCEAPQVLWRSYAGCGSRLRVA